MCYPRLGGRNDMDAVCALTAEAIHELPERLEPARLRIATGEALFGLTNDAFGYHLTKADFQRFPHYDDVSRTSPGELTGKILTENYLDLIRRSLGALSSAE